MDSKTKKDADSGDVTKKDLPAASSGTAGEKSDGATVVVPAAALSVVTVKRNQAPSPEEPEPKHSVIGPYELIEPIGRGGQGMVFLAEDLRLRRRVALKVLSSTVGLSSIEADRFKLEGEIASRLDHPGIATVYDVGIVDGTPYLAMRFVEGKTLSALIKAAREQSASPDAKDFWSSDSVARVAETSAPTIEGPASGLSRADSHRFVKIIAEAARALHFAHDAGVIHRDIKPANIMVTAEGRPVILDFGLARDERRQDASLTRTGDFFGTPAYMSPEQISGGRIKLDRRTDVYSLGTALYECLTLRKPFEAPTHDELYAQIRTKEPRRVRELNRAVSRDLEIVVETAMSKDLGRRYKTASDFADDLEACLESRTIAARRVGPLGRTARYCRREPLKAAFIALLLLTIPTISVLFVRDRLAESDRLEAERIRTERACDELLARGFFELGDGGNPEGALVSFRSAEKLDPTSIEAFVGVALALVRCDRTDEAKKLILGRAEEEKNRSTLTALIAEIEESHERSGELKRVTYAPIKAESAVDYFLEGIRRLDDAHNGVADMIPKAVESLRRAILASPNPRAFYFAELAHALGHLGDKAALDDLVCAAKLLWPPAPSLWNAFGNAYSIMNEDDTAREFLEEAVRKQPDFVEALRRLGQIECQMGNSARGLELLRRAKSLRPNDWMNSAFLTNGLAYAGEFDATDIERKTTKRLKPRSAVTQTVYRIYISKNHWDRAHPLIVEWVGETPQDAEAWYDLGQSFERRNEFADALESYEKAVALDPNDRETWFRIGYVTGQKLDDKERAMVAYRKALEVDPAFGNAWWNIGILENERGKGAEALMSLSMATRLLPRTTDVWQAYAKVAFDRKDLRAARDGFRRLTELDEKSTEGWFGLFLTAERLADYDVALDAAQRAAPGYSNFGPFWTLWAQTASAAGRFDLSVSSLSRAVELGLDPEAHLSALVDALLLAGQFEAAREALTRLRSTAKNPTITAEIDRRQAEVERRVAAQTAIADFLEGQSMPETTADRLDMARLAARMWRYDAALRAYDVLFAGPLAQEKSLEYVSIMVDAAQVGILLPKNRTVGGAAAAPPPADEIKRRKEEALNRLQRAVQLLEDLVDRGTVTDEAAQKYAEMLSQAPWLADFRDPKTLAALPAAEREAWNKLTQALDGLR